MTRELPGISVKKSKFNAANNRLAKDAGRSGASFVNPCEFALLRIFLFSKYRGFDPILDIVIY